MQTLLREASAALSAQQNTPVWLCVLQLRSPIYVVRSWLYWRIIGWRSSGGFALLNYAFQYVKRSSLYWRFTAKHYRNGKTWNNIICTCFKWNTYFYAFFCARIIIIFENRIATFYAGAGRRCHLNESGTSSSTLLPSQYFHATL